ncbi:MAG: hypothetical protein EA001_11870 [Oscillatoriales cyanobacterium]|nr:MAG: hypothetical protein EA001_11870 [Oscillatoriales cyanobacterium]
MSLVWAGTTHFPSPTALDNWLKPLAPHDQVTIKSRQNQGFRDLVTAPKPLVSRTIEAWKIDDFRFILGMVIAPSLLHVDWCLARVGKSFSDTPTAPNQHQINKYILGLTQNRTDAKQD